MVANDQVEEYRTMDTFCDAGDYRLLARISFYFAVCSFSTRVATHSLWLGFDFAVCTFPYRMARVMECLAKIGCPILKFPVIIDFVLLWC